MFPVGGIAGRAVESCVAHRARAGDSIQEAPAWASNLYGQYGTRPYLRVAREPVKRAKAQSAYRNPSPRAKPVSRARGSLHTWSDPWGESCSTARSGYRPRDSTGVSRAA